MTETLFGVDDGVAQGANSTVFEEMLSICFIVFIYIWSFLCNDKWSFSNITCDKDGKMHRLLYSVP